MKTLQGSTRRSRRRPVSFRLPGDYEIRLTSHEAAARRSRSELAREWAQERLDVLDFPCLEFRSNCSGRFAVIRGTRLAVWQLAALAAELGWGKKLAQHLDMLPEAVAAAEGYHHRHRAEIDALVAANDTVGFDQAKGWFPKLRRLDEISA